MGVLYIMTKYLQTKRKYSSIEKVVVVALLGIYKIGDG
jgi:hypothetical protein